MFQTWPGTDTAPREARLEGKNPIHYVNWMCMKNTFSPSGHSGDLENVPSARSTCNH